MNLKQFDGGANLYAAFVTLLFNPETLEFVKIGSVSVRGVQRTANVCESDTLPENCTLEMIRKMPQVEINWPAAHAKTENQLMRLLKHGGKKNG